MASRGWGSITEKTPRNADEVPAREPGCSSPGTAGRSPSEPSNILQGGGLRTEVSFQSHQQKLILVLFQEQV